MYGRCGDSKFFAAEVKQLFFFRNSLIIARNSLIIARNSSRLGLQQELPQPASGPSAELALWRMASGFCVSQHLLIFKISSGDPDVEGAEHDQAEALQVREVRHREEDGGARSETGASETPRFEASGAGSEARPEGPGLHA